MVKLAIAAAAAAAAAALAVSATAPLANVMGGNSSSSSSTAVAFQSMNVNGWVPCSSIEDVEQNDMMQTQLSTLRLATTGVHSSTAVDD